MLAIKALSKETRSIVLFTDNDLYENGVKIAEKLKELGFVKEGFETPWVPNTYEAYSKANRKNVKVWCYVLDKEAIKKYFEQNPITQPGTGINKVGYVHNF